MAKEIEKIIDEEEWYKALIEELKAIITEGIFRSRMEMIEAHHKFGMRALEENSNFKRAKIYGKKIVQCIAQSLGRSTRAVWQDIQFARDHPDLEKWLGAIEEGKNISWYKITQKYLSASKEKPLLLPEGKYEIIYVDPAWEYPSEQHAGAGEPTTGGSGTHYGTMTDKEIKEAGIGKIASSDCLLFMWATGPKLKVAIEVGEAWGFEYSTMGFVWYKEKPNPGTYTMSECEYCLIFRKGNIPQPRGDRNIRQFLSEKRTEHSRKPNEIRDRITRMFPKQAKVEFFARKFKGMDKFKKQKWTFMGNEL